MVDDLYAVQNWEQGHGVQIALDEREAGTPEQAGDMLFLLPAGVVVGEGVDATDFVTGGQQMLTEVRADESRGTGHKSDHLAGDAIFVPTHGASGALPSHALGLSRSASAPSAIRRSATSPRRRRRGRRRARGRRR